MHEGELEFPHYTTLVPYLTLLALSYHNPSKNLNTHIPSVGKVGWKYYFA